MLAALALAACGAMSIRPQPPEVELASVDAVSVVQDRARLRVTLGVRNPNAFALDVRSLDYSVRLADRDAATGTLVQPVSLAASATTPVSMDLDVDFRLVGRALELALREGSLRYDVRGDLVTGNGTRLPFARAGNVDAARLLRRGATP